MTAETAHVIEVLATTLGAPVSVFISHIWQRKRIIQIHHYTNSNLEQARSELFEMRNRLDRSIAHTTDLEANYTCALTGQCAGRVKLPPGIPEKRQIQRRQYDLEPRKGTDPERRTGKERRRNFYAALKSK